MLASREYRINYVTIPITLKLKTPEIGAFTYFGQFGVNLSIKTKAKSVSDEGVIINNNGKPPQDIDITNDMGFLNMGLNIGAGFEYNLAGSTSVVVGINYHNGFTNVLRTTSKQLKTRTFNSTTQTYDLGEYTQKATSNYVSLTIGILF